MASLHVPIMENLMARTWGTRPQLDLSPLYRELNGIEFWGIHVYMTVILLL